MFKMQNIQVSRKSWPVFFVRLFATIITMIAFSDYVYAT